MNDKGLVLSKEQLDFLSEMMNVGAGNAATAFTQMLGCEVNLKMPAVHVLSAPKVIPILHDPSLPVACVRMGLVGDVTGDMFFVVSEEQKTNLIHLMERAPPLGNAEGKNPQSAIRIPHSTTGFSVLAEIGNILVGVYLTAIHDFCKLNIYHRVPIVAVDMIQSLLDESLVALRRQIERIVVVENELIVEEKRIRTFLLFVPSAESVNTLVDSIGQARIAMCEE